MTVFPLTCFYLTIQHIYTIKYILPEMSFDETHNKQGKLGAGSPNINGVTHTIKRVA